MTCSLTRACRSAIDASRMTLTRSGRASSRSSRSSAPNVRRSSVSCSADTRERATMKSAHQPSSPAARTSSRLCESAGRSPTSIPRRCAATSALNGSNARIRSMIGCRSGKVQTTTPTSDFSGTMTKPPGSKKRDLTFGCVATTSSQPRRSFGLTATSQSPLATAHRFGNSCLSSRLVARWSTVVDPRPVTPAYSRAIAASYARSLVVCQKSANSLAVIPHSKIRASASKSSAKRSMAPTLSLKSPTIASSVRVSCSSVAVRTWVARSPNAFRSSASPSSRSSRAIIRRWARSASGGEVVAAAASRSRSRATNTCAQPKAALSPASGLRRSSPKTGVSNARWLASVSARSRSSRARRYSAGESGVSRSGPDRGLSANSAASGPASLSSKATISGRARSRSMTFFASPSTRSTLLRLFTNESNSCA